MNYILSYNYCNLNRVECSGIDITSIYDNVLSETGIKQIVKLIKYDCSSRDITSISNDVLGEASQAMDSGVYLVHCIRCPTVPNSGVLVGNVGFRAVFIMTWWWIVPWL